MWFDPEIRILAAMDKTAVNIRMPVGMKRALDEIAEREFRSLNSVILQFIDEAMQGREITWQEEEKPKEAKKKKKS